MKKQIKEHDGCDGCKYEKRGVEEQPCSGCRGTQMINLSDYPDLWEEEPK